MHGRRVVAGALLCGLACGENVLVSRWEFGLKTEDGGLPPPSDPTEAMPSAAGREAADAGFFNQAESAERARDYAHKNDDRSGSHDDESAHSSDESSSQSH